MKKALVTGGAGFMGFHLAKTLAKDRAVIICDNLSRGKMDGELKAFLEQKNVEFVQCDLTDADKVADLEKADEVYHLAAVQGTKNFYEIPHKVIRTNLLSTINLLDWFVQSKSGKILFSSSSEAYAGTVTKFGGQIPTPEEIPLCVEDPYNPRWSYGASKIAGEVLFTAYAKGFGMDFVIIRYHNVYGPRMGFDHVVPEFIARTLRKENPFQVYGGQETRAFCFVDDAVEATRLAMQRGQKTIHIGTGEEVKIIDLAKKIHKIMKFEADVKVNPAPKGSV
ncbi:SDR family NAD(P)-dependent oxidoreductase, partial [Candidatus Micrarchaeota archaeon]|nr:SDR family NAD(P)-dependent oxidoreductase [Candidatus Micrarchaeota archaeon]